MNTAKFKTVASKLALPFLLAMAAFLNIWNLWSLGVGNTYYGAAIKSMLSSFSNFFFVSFDSAGFISVDKAPLSLWTDTIFAKIFSFNGFVILLPHAIEGILVTFLVYKITKKYFGRLPGFIAGLVITLSPVNVAVYRNNTPDALLLVFILLTIWFAGKYFDTKRTIYILLTALMLGLGFNTKMLQAFLILPALLSALFIFGPVKLKHRIKPLLLFVTVTAIISFSWITIVDLTPASMRPYVGSSGNNSAWNLALGYNGIERFEGETGVGGTPGFNIGDKGIFRLFTGEMGTQSGWFLLTALIFAAVWLAGNMKKLFRRAAGKEVKFTPCEALTFVSIVFLLTEFVFFSYASFFHSYYLNIVEVSIALLTGALVYELKTAQHKKLWKWLLLGASLPVQGLLIYVSNYNVLLVPLIIALGMIGLVLVFMLEGRLQLSGKILLILSLLTAPFLWSIYTTLYGNTATAIFIGGPAVAGADGRGGPGGGNFGGGNPFGSQNIGSEMISYLKANYNGEKYFVGVNSAGEASGYILDENIGNVMTLGGFSGRDQAISLTELKDKISNGEIRFFYLGGNSRGFGGFGSIANGPGTTTGGGMFNANEEITSWITTTCQGVSGMNGLYDCQIVLND